MSGGIIKPINFNCPFKLPVSGNKTFPVSMMQGPLAGISSAPFRLLCARYSAPALVYSEMVSCKTLIHDSRHTVSSFIRQLPGEGPLGVQLSGTSPQEVAEAVRIATDAGAASIDLNCGCPVKKIRRRGAGSALLSSPQGLYSIIHAMKQNTVLPVSVKIRVDGNSGDAFNETLVQVLADAGIDFLTVHGRNWRDSYETPCYYEQIAFFVDALKIPVIGNGDIACKHSFARMLTTGCAGIMISRGSVGRPWLLGNLRAEMLQLPVLDPSLAEIGEVLLEHVQLLAEFIGSEAVAIQQARKFCKYYARDLPEKTAFCEAVNTVVAMRAFEKICRRFFCE